ncbi:hypothetical protein EMCG_03765 [[Emmonsia] crescens]|uniref:Uncharacterized protein n=1 Tax=[Emmonsia] crescens TaxID=73230 RepID=A0A0G2J874_9EURO|nr:hypothetical protein EMCG_03765 [Emmonsia crescens UAMH 3008]
MENMQHMATHKQPRKRASTQAIRDNAEPNKRTDRSQDRGDEQPKGLDPWNQIRMDREAWGTKEGRVAREVRQRRRLYCCGCDKEVGIGVEMESVRCPVCYNENDLIKDRQ